ncbi:hypothetical protein Cantr_00550 [Candida viswanathii]|uniref:Major facilitator superfamily (MFS) profile domain-containing protein n=1 Tax=Candida viswanathii TaxID=5486 RepID=A0A367YG99_9ASCO|nr:hypothetical protein Cantr_00550 [Candida viswanathii]
MHLLKSLSQSNTDIRILWTSVFLRMASYGLTNQVLTLYLKSLDIDESNIGLFMTLTLVGDTFISYYLTWNADRIGRKIVMIIGTMMMLVSGLVFYFSSNFYVLLAAAIFGVISPSGDETGPFKSVEEASIAHLTPHNHRPEIFAFYGLFATFGAALGSLVCGGLIDYWNLSLDIPLIRCYKLVFLVYAVIALVKFCLMCFVSVKVEVGYDNFVDEHTELLEGDRSASDNEEEDSKPSWFDLSKTAKFYLPRLLCVFMLDSLGYGFMPSAWIVYYLKMTFSLTAMALGTLFFITNMVDSVSSLPSAFLSKFLGPVKAILFTQVPSAIFMGLITFCTTYFPVAALLVLYYTTSTMDVVPRQILLTSIMPKRDVTKVMGIVNIGKTLARCVGPIITGKLASANKLYFGFLINSVCVLLADVVLATNFLHLDRDILLKQGLVQNIE